MEAKRTYDFEAEFEDARKGLAKVYRRLNDLLVEDKDGIDDPFPGMSGWDVLYGLGTREAMKKIKEALMWLDNERMSVG